MNRQKEDAWQEAKRQCRLTDDDVTMAKELGFQPKSLIKNIPSRSQRWKMPVNEWVRSLYEDRFGSRKPVSFSGQGEERRDPQRPWPDNPEIADLPPIELHDDFPQLEFETDEFEDDEFYVDPFELHRFEPPDEANVEEENGLMLRRQKLFRWAAEAIAIAWSELPEVEEVAAFGAVSQPLQMEVPRFREFRRHHLKVLHECADLDLAVWLTKLTNLRELKKAMARGLALVQDTPYGGVAHHQVDVHVFEYPDGGYRGSLCIFGECPKPGKRECHVPGCGKQPFLQIFARYHFNPARFSAAPKVILFDRAAGLLVAPPKIDGKPREVKRTPRETHGSGITEDDVPF